MAPKRVGPRLFAVLVLGILLLVPLAPCTAATAGNSRASGAMPSSETTGPDSALPSITRSLPVGYFNHFGLHSTGGNTKLTLTVNATEILDIYVMDSYQYDIFANTNLEFYPISQFTTDYVSTQVALPSAGWFYIVVWNDISQEDVSYNMTYWTNPVDLNLWRSSSPAPIGLADYGEVVAPDGSVLPYEERIAQVTGDAAIRSMVAYNGSTGLDLNSNDAGLQMNVVLRVNATSGQYVYWLQNCLQLHTDSDTVRYLDNVWNDSAADSKMSGTWITGSATFSSVSSGVYIGKTQNYDDPWTHYAMPWEIQVTVAVSHSQSGVVVSFGYRNASAGAQLPAGFTYYDKVLLTEPGSITDAAIVVSGNEMTPDWHYYNAEFVFTGVCCRVGTTFNAMDSTMNMMYVLADGSGSRPKSLFQFGSDTGESVYNLHVSQVGSSLQVGLGNEDFGTSFTTPITLTCKALTMAVGATTTCTAKVTASLLTPVLTLRSNHAGVFTTVKGTGAASVFSCKLVKGACSFKYKATSASSTTVITAAYPGDSNNLGGYAAFSLDVTLKTPKMTVSCKPISVVAGSSVNVRCTAKVTGYSTTGTITWSSTGPGTVSLPQGMTCTLTKGSCFVTFRGTSSGPVTIQASYGGDRNNAASTGTRNLTIK